MMLTLNNQYSINNNISYGDKSITHRALILASIASDSTIIRNASLCQDCMTTLKCLTALGAKFAIEGTTIHVQPIITKINYRVTLECNNSGTTARLLLGLCVGMGIEADFVGDQSLMSRPMSRIIVPLVAMGANIKVKTGCLFATYKSKTCLAGISYAMPIASAQVKSSIIIAGMFASGSTAVTESITTRNHTEIMARHMGANINIGKSVVTVGKSKLLGGVIDIPNDISSAIYPIILAVRQGGITLPNVGVNPTRNSCIDALIAAGADITIANRHIVCGEDTADIVVNQRIVGGINLSQQQCAVAIDELLPLAVLASITEGVSVFDNVQELLYKESNRVQAIVELATQLGATTRLEGTQLTVIGKAHSEISPIDIITHGDHRVAMSAIMAGMLSSGSTIDDYRCISVSCTSFLQMLGINKKSFALIGGASAKSSKSPIIYAELARQLGVNCSYDIVAQDNLSESQLLNIIGRYDGVNITMPYKSTVARILGSSLNSVNTVYGNKQTTSTDGYGIICSMLRHNIDIHSSNVLIIGAGGAGEAVATALVERGCKVNIVNRTPYKATQLHTRLDIDYNLHSFDGVISCVPPCAYELDAVATISNPIKWVFSLSYKSESLLQSYCSDSGIEFYDGLEMLYYQASKSFALFSGSKAVDIFDQIKERLL